MLEKHKTFVDSEKRRSELASGSNIDLSEGERNSQLSGNDLNDLAELDVNDINIDHNEFFRQDTKLSIEPSPMALKKDLSFASTKDAFFLNIKETAMTEFTQETYWM